MVRVAPQLVSLGSYRSVYRTVCRYIREPHLRQALSFHSLLVGGNPLTASSIYTLIHGLERKWGVWFPMGGTGVLVRGSGPPVRGTGGRTAAGLRSAVHPHRSGHRHRPRGSGRRRGALRRGGEQRQTWCTPTNGCWDTTRRGARAARRLRRLKHGMSLFLVYFGTRARYPGLAHPQRGFRAALPGAPGRHLRPRRAAGGLLALPARAHLHRSVAGAAGMPCLLRPGPGCPTSGRPTSTGRRWDRVMPGNCCPVWSSVSCPASPMTW